jgi:hypothetical protein
MSSQPPRKRAFSPNRGGSGSGYEQTNPDFEDHKLARLKADYAICPPQFKKLFLDGLSRFERNKLTGRIG